MSNVDKDRGTGRTTRQMEALPIGGVYISCHHASVYYDKNLTRKINRPDITVVPPSWVTSMIWQGRTYTGIALDHAYSEMHKNDPLFNAYLDQVRARIRK